MKITKSFVLKTIKLITQEQNLIILMLRIKSQLKKKVLIILILINVKKEVFLNMVKKIFKYLIK